MADLFQTIAEVFRSYHAWGLTNPFPCVLTFRKQSMYIAHCTLYIDYRRDLMTDSAAAASA